MDQVDIVRNLDKFAGILRGFGLHPITRLGRHMVKHILTDDFSVRFNGMYISGPIELRGLLYRIKSGMMEPFMSSLFKDAIKPQAVVLDIGANLGYYSLLAANLGAKVFAFEPDPLIFPYLLTNIQKNGFMDRITAVNKAVSEKTGMMPFLLHDCPASNSLFDTSGDVKETIQVECITIDKSLDKNIHVDIIKMDIQGAELHALKGMEQTIKCASGHLTIFAECWPRGLLMAGNSAGDLINHLRGLGLSVMIIDEQNHCLSPVNPDIEQMKEVNLHCKTHGSLIFGPVPNIAL